MLEKDNKITIPLSIIVAGIIVAAAFIFVNQEKIKGLTVKELPAELVAEEAINYINDNLLAEGISVSLVDVSDAGSVYKIRLKIGEQEYESYVSKDGVFLFPEGGINMKELVVQETENEIPAQAEQSSVPQEELNEFVGCLARANLVIYGANRCGWTQRLVTMLGGWETIKPIYVECTEESELCQEKEIAGYPTILINGKQYQGDRTFEGFSEATGCQAPEGAESLNSEQNPTGGCQ
ncbi:MAG: hypothetical protein Q8M00_02515 [bacterium]|nr:hypothetical protein [bacterium]